MPDIDLYYNVVRRMIDASLERIIIVQPVTLRYALYYYVSYTLRCVILCIATLCSIQGDREFALVNSTVVYVFFFNTQYYSDRPVYRVHRAFYRLASGRSN